jgi:hypothetical protein
MQKTTTVEIHGASLPSALVLTASPPKAKAADCFIMGCSMKHIGGPMKSFSRAEEKGTKAMSDSWLAAEYGKEWP